MILKPCVVVFFVILICTLDIVCARNLETKLFNTDVATVEVVEGQLKAVTIQIQDSENKLDQISGSLEAIVQPICDQIRAARMQIQNSESMLRQISGRMEVDEEISRERLVEMFMDDTRENLDDRFNNGVGGHSILGDEVEGGA
ncbi:unnamed protein product [Lactuca saligna]|uniref:Uncharacterized protein n=1 Tax=Lactuca saligna TaxID=75948 RepID=A0AA35UZ75_LACSI|nr:unnamed protein product [Lactuca saligna]